MKGPPDDRNWLEAEENGREEAAETAFAALVAGLPAVEPAPDFVGRTVRAAARRRARRRLTTRFVQVAALLLISLASLGSLYLFGMFMLGTMVRGTAWVAQGLVWLMTSVDDGVRWWSIADRVGTALGQVLAAPGATAAIGAIEIVGAMAMVAFHWLLREEDGRRNSQKVRR